MPEFATKESQMTDERPNHPKPQTARAADVRTTDGSQQDGPNADEPPHDGPEPLRLDHFLKLSAMSESGGQAKVLIQGGEVKVNGEVETRRRRKLKAGDVVELDGKKYPVTSILGAE